MFKLWIEQNILSKKDIQTMERRIKEFDAGWNRAWEAATQDVS